LALQHLSPSLPAWPWLVRLRQRKALMTVASNAGWLLADRMVRLLLGFVVGAWVARYLGPSQFGHLSYVLSFIALFQAITTLGADTIIVRDIAHQPDMANELLGALFRMRLGAGIICWVLAIVISAIINPAEHGTILLTAIVGGILVFQAADTIDLWFQSQSQSKRTVQAKLVAYMISNGFKLLLIFAKAPLIAFAFAFLLDTAVAAGGLAVAYRTLPTARKWHADLHVAWRLARTSWPFLISGLSVMIYMRIDQIMLKEMRGDRELGIYAAALPISQLWQTIPMTLSISLAPFVARKKKESQQAYEDALLHIFRLFGLCALIVSCATAAMAPIIIPFLYGPNFVETSRILSIHVFSNIFVALGVAQGLWLTNENAGHLSLIKTVCGGIAAVVGNAILIPKWGAEGAAIVCILSFATSAVLTNIILAPRIFLMQLGIRVSR